MKDLLSVNKFTEEDLKDFDYKDHLDAVDAATKRKEEIERGRGRAKEKTKAANAEEVVKDDL